MTDFVLTEFVYHIVSGFLILGVVAFFVWKARHTHFPEEKKPEPPYTLIDDKLKPQQRRVMGFPGTLF